jgi:hypothetical protein
MRFEVQEHDTTHISFGGVYARSPTVIVQMGSVRLSRKALILGVALAACQVFDGILTFIGTFLLGVEMEGNGILRGLMHLYGAAPVLFVIKAMLVGVIVVLTFFAHRRRWIRPFIFGVVSVYVIVALIPWVYIISSYLLGY